MDFNVTHIGYYRDLDGFLYVRIQFDRTISKDKLDCIDVTTTESDMYIKVPTEASDCLLLHCSHILNKAVNFKVDWIGYDTRETLFHDDVYLIDLVSSIKTQTTNGIFQDSVCITFTSQHTVRQVKNFSFKVEDGNRYNSTINRFNDADVKGKDSDTITQVTLTPSDTKTMIDTYQLVVTGIYNIGTDDSNDSYIANDYVSFRNYDFYYVFDFATDMVLQNPVETPPYFKNMEISIDTDENYNDKGYLKTYFTTPVKLDVIKKMQLKFYLEDDLSADVITFFDQNNITYEIYYEGDSDGDTTIKSVTYPAFKNSQRFKNLKSGNYIIGLETEDLSIPNIYIHKSIFYYGKVSDITRTSGNTMSVEFTALQLCRYINNAKFDFVNLDDNTSYKSKLETPAFTDTSDTNFTNYISFLCKAGQKVPKGNYKFTLSYTDKFSNKITLEKEFELSEWLYGSSIVLNKAKIDFEYNDDGDKGYLTLYFNLGYNLSCIMSQCKFKVYNSNKDISSIFDFSQAQFTSTGSPATDNITEVKIPVKSEYLGKKVNDIPNSEYNVDWSWNDLPITTTVENVKFFYCGCITEVKQTNFNELNIKISKTLDYSTVKNATIQILSSDGNISYASYLKTFANSNTGLGENDTFKTFNIQLANNSLPPDDYIFKIKFLGLTGRPELEFPFTTTQYLYSVRPLISNVSVTAEDDNSNSNVTITFDNYICKNAVNSIYLKNNSGFNTKIYAKKSTFDAKAKTKVFTIKIDTEKLKLKPVKNGDYEVLVNIDPETFLNDISHSCSVWYYGSIDSGSINNIHTLKFKLTKNINYSELTKATFTLYTYKKKTLTAVDSMFFKSLGDSNSTSGTGKTIYVTLKDSSTSYTLSEGMYLLKLSFSNSSIQTTINSPEFYIPTQMYGVTPKITDCTPILSYHSDLNAYSGYLDINFNVGLHKSAFTGKDTFTYTFINSSGGSMGVFNSHWNVNTTYLKYNSDKTLVTGFHFELDGNQSISNTYNTSNMRLALKFDSSTYYDCVNITFAWYIYGGLKSVAQVAKDTLLVNFTSQESNDFIKSAQVKVYEKQNGIWYENTDFQNVLYADASGTQFDVKNSLTETSLSFDNDDNATISNSSSGFSDYTATNWLYGHCGLDSSERTCLCNARTNKLASSTYGGCSTCMCNVRTASISDINYKYASKNSCTCDSRITGDTYGELVCTCESRSKSLSSNIYGSCNAATNVYKSETNTYSACGYNETKGVYYTYYGTCEQKTCTCNSRTTVSKVCTCNSRTKYIEDNVYCQCTGTGETNSSAYWHKFFYIKLKSSHVLYSGTYKIEVIYTTNSGNTATMSKTWKQERMMSTDFGSILFTEFLPEYYENGLSRGYLNVRFENYLEKTCISDIQSIQVTTSTGTNVTSYFNTTSISLVDNMVDYNGKTLVNGFKLSSSNQDLTAIMLQNLNLIITFKSESFIDKMTKTFILKFRICSIGEVIRKTHQRLDTTWTMSAVDNTLLSKLSFEMYKLDNFVTYSDYKEIFNSTSIPLELMLRYNGKKLNLADISCWNEGSYDIANGSVNSKYTFRIYYNKKIEVTHDYYYQYKTNYSFFKLLVTEFDSSNNFIKFNELIAYDSFQPDKNTSYIKISICNTNTTNVEELDVSDLLTEHPTKVDTASASRTLNWWLAEDSKIDPGYYRVGLKYEGSYILGPWEGFVQGMVNSTLDSYDQSSVNDKTCYIVRKTTNGVDAYHVYTNYNRAYNAYNKKLTWQDKLTDEEWTAQYNMCKECKKKNIIYTKASAMVIGSSGQYFNWHTIHTQALKIVARYLTDVFGCKNCHIVGVFDKQKKQGLALCDNQITTKKRKNGTTCELITGYLSMKDKEEGDDIEVYLLKVTVCNNPTYRVFYSKKAYKKFLKAMEEEKDNFEERKKNCQRCAKVKVTTYAGKAGKIGKILVPLDMIGTSSLQTKLENNFNKILKKVSVIAQKSYYGACSKKTTYSSCDTSKESPSACTKASTKITTKKLSSSGDEVAVLDCENRLAATDQFIIEEIGGKNGTVHMYSSYDDFEY
jgi:hypothetical protein